MRTAMRFLLLRVCWLAAAPRSRLLDGDHQPGSGPVRAGAGDAEDALERLDARLVLRLPPAERVGGQHGLDDVECRGDADVDERAGVRQGAGHRMLERGVLREA